MGLNGMTRAERDHLRARRLPLLTVRLLDMLDNQDKLIRQLSERVAICSELLGRAAERQSLAREMHDEREKLRRLIHAKGV